MANNMPIPAPPRTPTPPPEDTQPGMAGLGLDGMGDLLSPTKMSFDPNTLSPMRENFALGRYATGTSGTASSSQPLSPTSTNSIYSSMSTESNGSYAGTPVLDGKGPFNFQPMSLAKSPISKSVGTLLYSHYPYPINLWTRVLARGAVINTSIAVYHIKYS